MPRTIIYGQVLSVAGSCQLSLQLLNLLTMSAKTLSIGTRGSPLALAQAHQVRDLLLAEAKKEGQSLTVEVVV